MVQWDTECWGGDSTAWYCQKRIRPLLRGYSHAAACVLSPLYAAERLAVAKTDSVAAAVILEAAAQMMLFGASAAYHRGQWSMWGEALAARVDYVGGWCLPSLASPSIDKPRCLSLGCGVWGHFSNSLYRGCYSQVSSPTLASVLHP